MKTEVCLIKKSQKSAKGPVSLPTLISRKNEKCYLSELAKIAAALGVTLKDFFIENGRITYKHVLLMYKLAEELNMKTGR